jgi:hypothetical protein
MIRIALSKKEAFFLLLTVESFLPEAETEELEALESCLAKLQSYSPAAPFRTATEAKKHAHY